MTSCAYDVLSEHQHIRQQVDALEHALSKRGQDGRAWLDEIRPLFGELASGLKSHSRGEEAEFFADVHRRLPSHVQMVQAFTEQHRCLTHDLEVVANQVATLDPQQPENVEEFATLLSMTLNSLRTHEERENELMHFAYWQGVDESL
jgi:hemerythrin-like domain-containing protein